MNYPYKYIPIMSPVYQALKRWGLGNFYRGNNVFCSVCRRSFKTWLGNENHGACPYCQSACRHRMLYFYLDNRYSPQQYPVKVLSFAPAWGEKQWFRQRSHKFHYVTTDLSAPNVDFHYDIKNLLFKNHSFDIVICCHVLEHIPQDFKAIEEIFRVLGAGGTAFIQVPYNRGAKYTDEDPSIVDPAERERRWGQFDHVRKYGRDIVDRLRKPGFEVEVVNLAQNYTPQENKSLGFWDDTIFVCSKK